MGTSVAVRIQQCLALTLAATAALTLAGCFNNKTTTANRSAGSSILAKTCDPGTQVELANPTPGQGGVAPGIGTIAIVSNGNNNTLYNSYAQWYIVVSDKNGHTINGGPLNLISDRGGPHPYASDYYFSSTIAALPTGQQWSAGLVRSNGKCSPDFIGNFST